MEKQLLNKVIDTIAKLDAEVKIRGRKGATFPSHHNNLQSQKDYENELNQRFYSEKEVKVNVMLTNLLQYVKLRLRNF